jgi:BNR/Asp-box repeat
MIVALLRRQTGALLVCLFLCASPFQARAARDGSHDFDFAFGTFDVHVSRLLHPLSGDTKWVRADGTHVTSKVWDGRANLGVMEVDGPAGHVEGMTIDTYDPASEQWSISFASSRDGMLRTPMTGTFENGRGLFFDREDFNGRGVFVRTTFSDITPASYKMEIAYSADGGATWEPNWTANFTRASSPTQPAHTGAGEAGSGQRDFDFNFGTWRTHIRTLNGSGASATWVRLEGTVKVRKIWGGRASMEEIEAGAGANHFEGLTLFLFNPKSQQWTQTFADASDGKLTPSMFGAFKNGRGELIAQEVYNGKMALVRDAWSNIAPNAHHFEESVSTDNGKSWQPDFIANLSRL